MAYSTISKPSLHFNTKLYTGNDTGQSITGVGFEPSLTWIKSRTSTERHVLTDAVRGVYKELRSNETAAESDRTSYGGLSAFGADGFTVGADDGYNDSLKNYASWNWKANGAGSANTDGSINSTVSANTTAGFSIVSYTGNGTAGATVGHGLGSVPKVVIVKTRSGTGNWINYHSSVGNTKYLSLNQTNSAGTTNQAWNDTSPTNQVFSLGNSSEVNGNGTTMIAYCFADVKGYSKFGSYTGNGNADGAFIYTGFKPAFIFSKKTNASGTNWTIWDNKRSSSSGGNAINKILHPNVTNVENTADDTDFLSNGFKLRATAGGMNASGGTFIYMAFAEEPLVANVGASIPATAR
nr:hypothetical protein [uncultured Mediterranean phage uvMED]